MRLLGHLFSVVLADSPRYAEALERQQEWLVKGIQKLYLLARNGQPAHLGFRNDREVPTHELLSHLGVLNPEKGDRFEESPRAVEQDLAQRYSDCTLEQDHDERSPSTPSSDFDTCPPDPTDSTQSLPVASWENPTTSEIPPNMGLLVGEHLNKGISPSQFSAYLHAGDCEQTEDQRLPGTQEIFTPFAKYQMGLRVIESTGLWNDQGNLGPSSRLDVHTFAPGVDLLWQLNN